MITSHDIATNTCTIILDSEEYSLEDAPNLGLFIKNLGENELSYVSNGQSRKIDYPGNLMKIYTADDYESILLVSYAENPERYWWTFMNLSDFSVYQTETTRRPYVIKIFSDARVVYNLFEQPPDYWILLDLKSHTEVILNYDPMLYGYDGFLEGVLPYDPTLQKIATNDVPSIVNVETGTRQNLMGASSIYIAPSWSSHGTYILGLIEDKNELEDVYFNTNNGLPALRPETNAPSEALADDYGYTIWGKDERYVAVKYGGIGSPLLYFYDLETQQWLPSCYKLPSSNLEVTWTPDMRYIWFLNRVNVKSDVFPWRFDLYIIDTITGEYGIVMRDVGEASFIGWLGN